MTADRDDIQKLQVSVRRLQFVVLLLTVLCLVGPLCLYRTMVVHADPIPDSVTAKQFVLVDSNGKQQAILGTFSSTSTNGTPLSLTGLEILSPAGKQILALGGSSDAGGSPATIIKEQSEDGSSRLFAVTWAGANPNGTANPSAGFSNITLNHNSVVSTNLAATNSSLLQVDQGNAKVGGTYETNRGTNYNWFVAATQGGPSVNTCSNGNCKTH